MLDGHGSSTIPTNPEHVLKGQLASVGAVLDQLQSMQERLSQLQDPESILAGCIGSESTHAHIPSYTATSDGQGASVDSRCSVRTVAGSVPDATENVVCTTWAANDTSLNNSTGIVAAEEQEEGQATPDAIAEAKSWLLQLADELASQQSSRDVTSASKVVDGKSPRAAGTASGNCRSAYPELAPTGRSLGSESRPMSAMSATSATMSQRGKWVWVDDPNCPSDSEFSSGHDKHEIAGRVTAGMAGSRCSAPTFPMSGGGGGACGTDVATMGNMGTNTARSPGTAPQLGRTVERDPAVTLGRAPAPSSLEDEDDTAALQYSARPQTTCGLQEPAPPARREDLGRKQRPPQQPDLETGVTPGGVLTPTEPMDADVTEEDMRDWGRAVSGIFFDLASEGPSRAEHDTLEDNEDNTVFMTHRRPTNPDGLRVSGATVPTDKRLLPAARLESSVGSTEEGNLSSSMASTPGLRDSGSEHIPGQRSAAVFHEDRMPPRCQQSDAMQPVGEYGCAAASNFYTKSGSGLSATGYYRNIAGHTVTPTEACRQEALERAIATLSRPKSKSRLLLRERQSVPDTGPVGTVDMQAAAGTSTSPCPVEQPCHMQPRNSAWSEQLSDNVSISSASTRLAGRAFCSENNLAQSPVLGRLAKDGRRSCPSHPDLHLASPALHGGDGSQQVLERSATCSALSDASCTLDSTVPCGR